MTKDLEQLRLNMIRALMEMDHDSLLRVKNFLENETDQGWKEYINETNTEFIDYSKISKNKEENEKITFL